MCIGCGAGAQAAHAALDEGIDVQPLPWMTGRPGCGARRSRCVARARRNGVSMLAVRARPTTAIAA
ncbi:hypothetical protein BVIET440_90215 [Burkholderia vietnamiensis]|nr:hypothetical protein BVI2075_300047 [Burkholderia vietnamiensis]